jgi:restriction system protein
MMQNRQSEVPDAFEILLEEIEGEIDFVNDIGSQGFEHRDYERAKEALEFAGKMTAFRDKIISIRKEWDLITSIPVAQEVANERPKGISKRSLKNGVRTPEAAFFKPILETIVELGGSGKVSVILNKLEPKVKSFLKEVDHEPIGSKPCESRWRNTARWARNTMINEGLLKPDSGRGIWEISENGKQYLKS